MVEGEKYFTLHAPRQSGETTFLHALTDKINSEGKYYALTCSLMPLRNIVDDEKAMRRVVSQINQGMADSSVDLFRQKADSYSLLPMMNDPDRKVRGVLNQLRKDIDRELVVFFDEADCLAGPGLVTFLGQIRDAYQMRSDPGNDFPRSMALVGLRDVKDYQSSTGAEPKEPPPNPFNIKEASITLPNFTQAEIGILYRQRTAASG
jgi:hypothetical protein